MAVFDLREIGCQSLSNHSVVYGSGAFNAIKILSHNTSLSISILGNIVHTSLLL